MVKHTETIRQQKLTNCLRVFDHLLGLARKGLGKTQKGFHRLVKMKSFFFFIAENQLFQISFFLDITHIFSYYFL